MPFDATPEVMPTTLSIGEKAAQLIEAGRRRIAKPENWCKGDYYKSNTLFPSWDVVVKEEQFCGIGSVLPHRIHPNRVVEPTGPVEELAVASLNHIAWIARWTGFPQFNDHPDTTHQAVLDLMQKAATLVRAIQTI